MTRIEMLAIIIGIVALIILILCAVLYMSKRRHHTKGLKKKQDSSLQQTQTKVYSSNERLDGARVSHRRTHQDRISEETMWKQKKDKAETDALKKVDTDRKNKMLVIYSPCNADVLAIHENLTEAIGDGYEKPGVLLTPSDDKLYSPINGIVTWNNLDESMVKIQGEAGAEIILHCKYQVEDSSKKELFTMKASNQEMIRTGEMLCRFQNGLIKRNNKSIQIRMEISNYQEGQLLIGRKTNYVSHGDKVLTLRLES